MTYAISEDFASPTGQWEDIAPWDGTEHSDSAKGFITSQQHVDIRNFRVINQFANRPQNSLETQDQAFWETNDQANMETEISEAISEPWVLTPTYMENLTFSGNEITDVVRTAQGPVDGFTSGAGGGVGIWPAHTNQAIGTTFTTGTGWTAFNATLSVDAVTTNPFPGHSWLEIVTTVPAGSAFMSGSFLPAAASGQTWRFSCWLLGNAGDHAYIFIQGLNAAQNTVTDSSYSPQITLTGVPQRVTLNGPLVSASTAFIRCGCEGVANGQTVRMAAPMLTQTGLDVPYIANSSTTAGSSVTRSAGRIQAPSSLLGDGTQLAIAMRVRYGWDGSGAQDPAWWCNWESDSGHYLAGAHTIGNAGHIGQQDNGGTFLTAVKTETFPTLGQHDTLIFAATSTQLKVSVAGGSFATTTRSTIVKPTNTLFDIGSRDSNTFAGNILWVATYTGTLADADAATLSALGDTPPSFNTLGNTARVTGIWSPPNTQIQVEDVGVTSFTTGPMSTRGGWSGLQMTTTGEPLDVVLTSSIPSDNLNLSGMDQVSLILPDYNTFDGTSTIQLTSDPNGVFGNGHDSAALAFSANLSVMPQLLFNVSSFTNSGFDNTKVTGVRITLVKATAPASGQTITIMALRAVKSTWTESALDFDTRLQAICVPSTLTGSPYAGSVAKAFEFVRGDGSKLDPIPADGAYYIYFYPGGSTSPNDATGSNHNRLIVLLREQKNTGAGTGSHIEAALYFNDSATSFTVQNVSSSGGSPGTEVFANTYGETIGPALDPTKHYVFRVEVRGTQILASLYETDVNQNVGNLVWRNATTITDSSYTYKNGRVGFIADLLSRDSYVTAFDVATTGFAIFQTTPYVSRTPVDGSQLAAVFSEDENLFDSITGPDLFLDTTKTLSGLGSYRTTRSLTTNSFLIDDWTQSYLSLAIWVPANVTKANQPIILLNTNSGQENIPMPTLQPAQWNTLFFDLGLFRSLVTAASYSLTISASPNPDRALGFFWVDEIVVGRRRVSWSVRATTNGPWRDFKSLVNDPSGAVHFTPDERGTQLQLQAIALTNDAWVSPPFKLFPRYAQLGLPVYDQGFETD